MEYVSAFTWRAMLVISDKENDGGDIKIQVRLCYVNYITCNTNQAKEVAFQHIAISPAGSLM